MSEAGHRAPLSYHARMLADVHRVDAYERAIRRLVKPGDVVLDLGCGTGILAMLAARRGARVHAVESMAVAGIAEELIAINGLADRITVHRADARTLEPVEPVDLVVSDFLGCFLIDDRMLPAVVAAGRWLKPGGRFCPSHVELMIAPVGALGLPDVDVFADDFYGLDLRAAQRYALGHCHRTSLPPSTLFAPSQRYHIYTPPDPSPILDGNVAFVLERAGRLRGVAGWFVAELAPGVMLSTEPGIETHWGQLLFAIPAVDVLPGDVLTLRLALGDEGGDATWRWSGSLARGGATVSTFSLDEEEWLGKRKRVGHV
jgi:type I protein arginine methyltransferase